MVPGWMCIPQPFECEIGVRTPRHAELIEAIWAKAKTELLPEDI
jgi:hypothetical protein